LKVLNNIDIFNKDGLEFLAEIPDNSIDLILTDPPYITSRDTGMNKWVEHVAEQDKKDAKNIKTEEEWWSYKTLSEWLSWFQAGGIERIDEEVTKKKILPKMQKMKKDYLKYGSIYGKKFAVTTDYGDWDSEFTMEMLEMFMKHFYRVLKDGGSCIVFFDIWKLSYLKEMMEGEKFKQLRFIEWIKTNPQPINSSRNYLTNCREIALTGVKKGSSTFNSKYDNGIYEYPLQGGKWRFHPTQKSLPLFEDLILKHSNEGDTVLDCFLGSGTTAVAAAKNNRKFIGCEKSEEYFKKSLDRLKDQC
jgi:site-specific DNA-methyltransferase (adenine-specific)